METILAFLTVIAVIVVLAYTAVWTLLWFAVVRMPIAASEILGAVKWPAYWVPFFAWSWLVVRCFA